MRDASQDRDIRQTCEASLLAWLGTDLTHMCEGLLFTGEAKISTERANRVRTIYGTVETFTASDDLASSIVNNAHSAWALATTLLRFRVMVYPSTGVRL
jgi:hypothetical protein